MSCALHTPPPPLRGGPPPLSRGGAQECGAAGTHGGGDEEEVAAFAQAQYDEPSYQQTILYRLLFSVSGSPISFGVIAVPPLFLNVTPLKEELEEKSASKITPAAAVG